MTNKFKSKSEFTRNVLTLMTGTTIAQAIPIAISPILTRIYTPEDFGIVALFVAISTILSSLTNASYELAIVLPKKEEDAINLFALGFIITSLLSLFLLILIVSFNDSLTSLLGNKEIGFWLYFIPITVFFAGLFNILKYFNTRQENYKDIANVTIAKSIILAVIQLLGGFLKQGATSLITAQIVSNMFANLKLLKNIFHDKTLISKISRIKIMAVAKKYKNFPKFSMPSTILNVFSYQIPTILLGIFFNTTIVGFYYFANKLIKMPMGIIGGATGQVFYKEISNVKNNQEAIKYLTLKTLKKLFLIGIVPFSIILFWGDYIFLFVFGEKWIIAGEYAQLLSVWMMLNFIFSPLSNLCFIFEKQQQVLYFNVMTLLSTIVMILIGALFLENPFQTIGLMGIIGVFFWLYWGFFLLKLASINLKDIVVFWRIDDK
jgi:O-antigen/teichoic acid export membrane protein